jgi:hypothetical protein
MLVVRSRHSAAVRRHLTAFRRDRAYRGQAPNRAPRRRPLPNCATHHRTSPPSSAPICQNCFRRWRARTTHDPASTRPGLRFVDRVRRLVSRLTARSARRIRTTPRRCLRSGGGCSPACTPVPTGQAAGQRRQTEIPVRRPCRGSTLPTSTLSDVQVRRSAHRSSSSANSTTNNAAEGGPRIRW